MISASDCLIILLTVSWQFALSHAENRDDLHKRALQIKGINNFIQGEQATKKLLKGTFYINTSTKTREHYLKQENYRTALNDFFSVKPSNVQDIVTPDRVYEKNKKTKAIGVALFLVNTAMEQSSIKFGLSAHFPRHHWEKEADYLALCVKIHEKNLEIHDKAVSSAFQNIIAFLKSVNKTDILDSVDIYGSILQDDPNNLNALFGLHELTLSSTEKKEYESKIKEIMCSEIQETALPKAILEIGVALCLLIPRYKFEYAMSDSSSETIYAIKFDDYKNLVFQTENMSLDVDLYTDTYTAQKERVYSSIRYLKEGIARMNDINSDQNKPDVMTWKYFLAMAYNRLDHWIDQTSGSTMLRKQFSLSSLELFCEVAASSDPNVGEKFSRMYFQRCLAYIGHILVSRNDVLTFCENENFSPKFLMKYENHFIRQLWDDPKQSFTRALDYGYDPIVNTRYAKSLLHENNIDSAIEHINEVFENGDDNWFAASIRMNAYKIKQTENYKRAKQSGDLSSLTRDYLLKAEEDGHYCFNTFATAKDQSRYAAILRWLGTFPDGETVTEPIKIQYAMHVLNRIYEEQGSHTHFKVHKIMAECHKDMGELDEAIKCAIWALNSTPGILERIPISFSFLVDLLFAKLAKDSVSDEEKHCLLRQIRYYIESEINHRCHQLLKQKFQDIKLKDCALYGKIMALLERYDKQVFDEIKGAVNSLSFSGEHQKDHYLNVCANFDILFSIVRNCCRRYPDVLKTLLDFTIDSAAEGPFQTFVKMSLINLGRDHKEYTRHYSRRLRTIAKGTKIFQLDLFTSTREDYPEKESSSDFLMIHAPEDKDWVFYTFLPEMEQRPIKFEGCIPDRDFKKGETFEKNVLTSLAKSRKVLLVLTPNFLKRIRELLGDEILVKLDEMHNKREIDVITLFRDAVTLNLEKHAVLAKFENVHLSSNGLLEWNYLRILLLRPIRPLGTTRDPVKWKADINGNNLLPHTEEDDELYKEIAQHILPFGVPQALYILYHQAFVIGYDGEKKVPRWVAHRIDSNVERGIVSRKTHHKQLRNYRPDLTIPPQARSSQKDYQARRDLTVGHMTPLADHSSSLKLAKDTNIMTNMVPEVKNNCLWTRLEEYCRDSLTTTFETIYVMSGTLFLPIKTGDGRKVVTYEVIGSNNVAVPTDFFKIIVAKQSGKDPEVGAFRVPNAPLHDAELTDLSVSISWLEKQNGIELFKDLDKDVKDSKVTTLTITTPFFPKKDRVLKMIRDSNSLDSLRSIWDNLTSEEKSELQPNYDDKKSRIENKTESNRV